MNAQGDTREWWERLEDGLIISGGSCWELSVGILQITKSSRRIVSLKQRCLCLRSVQTLVLTSSLVDNQSFSRNMKRRWRHSLPQDSLCRHSDQISSRRSRSNCCLPRWWIHPVWSLCLLKIYVCQQINPLQINNAIFRPSRATSI